MESICYILFISVNTEFSHTKEIWLLSTQQQVVWLSRFMISGILKGDETAQPEKYLFSQISLKFSVNITDPPRSWIMCKNI